MLFYYKKPKGVDFILILISQKRGYALDNLKKKYNLEVDKINVSDLANFLTINKAKIEHATHVVIDLWGLIDTNEEITKAIDTLVNVYENARIIILADRLEGRDNSADLLNRIVKRGVYDIFLTVKRTSKLNDFKLAWVQGFGLDSANKVHYW